MIAVAALLILGGAGLGGWYFLGRSHTVRPDLLTQPVKKERLQITITERGSLEPADNIFFSCKVKSKTPGGASTSIRWVIDNGSFVKAGDKILELDDSALQDQRDTQQIEVYKAEQLWKQAELTLTINALTNKALVEQQKTNREVAEINLQEYLNGLYSQTKIDLENKRIMADSDLTMWQERSAWSDRMSRPGRQYVTVSQAEADAARHRTATLTLKNIRTQIEVLDKLTREKNRVLYQGQINEAERQTKLNQEKLDKQMDSDRVAVKSAYSQYQVQLAKLQEIEKEIDDCIIRAPRDGMVVYYVEERARWGSSQGMIAPGELVKEGQKLIAVPDLRRMVVNARIHEAMYDKVSKGADLVRQTGFSETVKGMLAFNPLALDGLCAYAAFELDRQTGFANLHADQEKILERRGLDASVRVNAFPDQPLKGHVKFVAPAPSQTDFFNSDVKVYQTYIAVDDAGPAGLRPGMDGVITINVDSTPEPVLTIPLQALLRGESNMPNKRRCFVVADGRPQMRDITLGKANEMLAEVQEGLEEGDLVVLNPAVLLSDKEKVKYGVSAASNQSGRGGPGAKQGGGQGKGGRGKGSGGRGKGAGGSPGMQGGGPRSQGGGAPKAKAAANP